MCANAIPCCSQSTTKMTEALEDYIMKSHKEEHPAGTKEKKENSLKVCISSLSLNPDESLP